MASIGLRLCSTHTSTRGLNTTLKTSISITPFSLLPSSTRYLSSASLRINSSYAITSRKEPSTLSSSSTSSFFTPSLCRRNASTTASTGPATSQQSSTTPLTWNTFFTLRTSRRRYSLASSIISSLSTTGIAFAVLSSQPDLADSLTHFVPDPFVSMGLLTFGATLLGWLIGPVFGNSLWKLMYRARVPEFTAKEKAFFERIKKHRVNPTGASTNNPVPDFYGEKIGSVQGYRRWLKDQRAFNRKREGIYTK